MCSLTAKTFTVLLLCVVSVEHVECSRYADQLYEDLLYYYNKNVRPVKNASSAVQVKFGASLIRIIDVDEVNQVLTTNLWLEMQWYDYKLTWDPEKWNNIKKLHIPSDQIWIPDILLYNNADGEPHISITSDALVYYTGAVVWKPPSIYKSFCPIDIEYFPYDKQSCSMKFGGWSYNGFLMDVRQLPSRPTDVIETRYDEKGKEYQLLEQGMDLSAFYPSLEWDLISLTSMRHEQLYPGCCGQEFYIDISFDILLRRKTLFYTVNLVIPCMLIAILTTFVFYIPGKEHKVTFSISILVTLTVFYLVLIELIPPTSLVIPLIGKYLLFTMFLVSASILLSVLTLNYYRRDGSAQPMPIWMRRVFLQTLPKYLFIKPPDDEGVSEDGSSTSDMVTSSNSRRSSPYFMSIAQVIDGEVRLSQLAQLRGMHPDLIRRMIDNISFISDHFRALKKEDKVSEDWSYVSMVIDRLMLILFSTVNVVGTFVILLQSPTFYDTRPPMSIMAASKPLSGDTMESFGNNSWQQ
uniref:Nicotinic acetylcholine receptor alpha subunit 8 n=1 Tax=Ascaris suum TaxID=6253 RepID=A0A2I6TEN1_ASCSU|nr:nicotinic acetylcholine receptor alpha subunit 8 [Ascaris suum]